MEQTVDQTLAMNELLASLKRVKNNPQPLCLIKPTIDFVLGGKNCLTYRYILLTALTAKATNESIDILSLQAGDASDGAYDARSLCSRVVYKFQKDFLDDVLDGSNEDPLVNNPGRHLRLSKENKSAGGDPKKALYMLCDNLPQIADSQSARECLDYFITECLLIAQTKREKAIAFSAAIVAADVFSTRDFMDSLLDKNYGGLALLLVANSIFSVTYPERDGYKVIPHPVNQSGASSSQMSDLDIYNPDGSPRLAIELKDKPFTEVEVQKAAKTAYECGAPSMLFIAGRSSSLTDEVYRYFNDAKADYQEKGMVIGVVAIDALLDYFFTNQYDFDAPFIFSLLEETMVKVHATPEAMSWVYQRIETL